MGTVGFTVHVDNQSYSRVQFLLSFALIKLHVACIIPYN